MEKALADTRGQSVNAYIISAVDEKMGWDGGEIPVEGPQEAAETAQRPGAVILLPGTRWRPHSGSRRPQERLCFYTAGGGESNQAGQCFLMSGY